MCIFPNTETSRLNTDAKIHMSFSIVLPPAQIAFQYCINTCSIGIKSP